VRCNPQALILKTCGSASGWFLMLNAPLRERRKLVTFGGRAEGLKNRDPIDFS
jgi:hypothetical protein